MSAETMLTAEDLELLARRLHGYLTVADGPVPPQPRPVWFEAAPDGTVQLFTPSGSPKLRRLRRDPRASLVVAAPADEREHWVSVTGRVTLESDGARELATRLAHRYWDVDERADDLTGLLAEEQIRIVLHPERVQRFAF